jgi:hypothetical protein
MYGFPETESAAELDGFRVRIYGAALRTGQARKCPSLNRKSKIKEPGDRKGVIGRNYRVY